MDHDGGVYRSMTIEDAQAVFATASPLVIRNTRLWWEEDEHETGVEPVVHIRALTGLAWLKKPSLCSDFKVNELVELCEAALRPSQRTWERFLRHLDTLEKSKKLSSDEVTAILVSAMSDHLLKATEFENDDPSDIDAVTLDEIVGRVTASYAADAKERVQAVTGEYEAKLAGMEERRLRASARLRTGQTTQRKPRPKLVGWASRVFWPLLLKLEFPTWVRSGAVALVADRVVSRVIP
jgi:hypothetical protein